MRLLGGVPTIETDGSKCHIPLFFKEYLIVLFRSSIWCHAKEYAKVLQGLIFWKICHIHVRLPPWWISLKCNHHVSVMCNHLGPRKRCIHLIVYLGGGTAVMLTFIWNIDGEKEIITSCGEWSKPKYFLLIGLCHDCLSKGFPNLWGNFFSLWKKVFFA